MANPLASAYLYGILDTSYLEPCAMSAMAQKLLQGGVDLLQLRAKNNSEAEIISMAASILPWTRAAGVPFILNDYPHLIPITGADGAHIGQKDMSVAQARRLAGTKALIGLSTHSLEQVKEACLQNPDYIGFGPLFETPTKPTYQSIGLESICSAQEIATFPVFCIGGINLKTLPSVFRAGARRVVVVSGLLKAEDPISVAQHIKGQLGCVLQHSVP
ncbi:MAG: thiamine phosphate synthase [Chthoniobacterales bacterium]|nr:thiamine phosphate synthase [Chthoniobacterales bacterium]